MAKFYATIEGSREPKTCTGTYDIKTSAQSYDGSVITSLCYVDNRLYVTIGTNDNSSTHRNHDDTTVSCEFDEFKDLLRLYNDIKSGKVSLVRHHTKKGAK